MDFIALTALALAAMALVSYVLRPTQERTPVRVRTDDRRR